MKQISPRVVVTILVVLLSLRALGQLLVAFSGSLASSGIFLVLAAVYITSIVGILQKKRWAPTLVIVMAVIDGLAAMVVIDGLGTIFALAMDVFLITLAVLLKRSHAVGATKQARHLAS